MIFTIIIMLILIGATFEDLRKKSIPIILVGMAGLVSVICVGLNLYLGNNILPDTMLSFLPGLAIIGIAYSTKQAIGFGDGLMICSIAPVFGTENLVTGVFLAFLFSSVVSIVLFILRKATRKTQIPFLPFITLGMGVVACAQI